MNRDRQITATVDVPVEIEGGVWTTRRYSRNFSETCEIHLIFTWAEALGLRNPSISDIQFSDHTGDSF